MNSTTGTYENRSTRSTRENYFKHETKRLSKGVDMLSRKLEQERRRNLTLDDKVRKAVSEVSERRTRLRKTLPTPHEEKKLAEKVNVLQNCVSNEKVKLNKQRKQNDKLRRDIDQYRRDKISYLEAFQKLRKKIKNADKKTDTCTKQTIKGARKEERIKRDLLALKEKTDSSYFEYASHISMMKNEIEADTRAQNQAIKAIANNKQESVHEDSSDIVKLLSFLHKKWDDQVKIQRKAMEQYGRKVRQLTESFNQIKEATGISGIGDMVTQFVKIEEQTFTLNQYSSQVNTDVDLLEQDNAMLRSRVAGFKKMVLEDDEADVNDTIALQGEIDDCKAQTQAKRDHIVLAKSHFAEIEDTIDSIVKNFEDQEFYTEISEKMKKDETEPLNEHTVSNRLNEVEEYIASLIKHVNYARGRENAEVSAIPLAALPEKDSDPMAGQPNINAASDMLDADADGPLDKDMMLQKAIEMLANQDN